MLREGEGLGYLNAVNSSFPVICSFNMHVAIRSLKRNVRCKFRKLEKYFESSKLNGSYSHPYTVENNPNSTTVRKKTLDILKNEYLGFVCDGV